MVICGTTMANTPNCGQVIPTIISKRFSHRPSDTFGLSSHTRHNNLIPINLFSNVSTSNLPLLAPLQTSYCPSDFKTRQGLGLMHINVRSIIPKLDMLDLWVNDSKPDILVCSETWLKSSDGDDVIAINDYNVFRCDRAKKGGVVCMYVHKDFKATKFFSMSVSKQFELLVINVEIVCNVSVSVVGVYRPPSATHEAVTSIFELLNPFLENEIVILGDFNLNFCLF